MEPTEKSVNWINKTALTVEATKEQQYMAHMLGKTIKEYPGNEKTLREIAVVSKQGLIRSVLS